MLGHTWDPGSSGYTGQNTNIDGVSVYSLSMVSSSSIYIGLYLHPISWADTGFFLGGGAEFDACQKKSGFFVKKNFRPPTMFFPRKNGMGMSQNH